VLTDAPTERVLFDGREAVGVQFQHRGETWHAHADGEVILAAGAIASPPLLQLSGVGPAVLLQRFGIPVVHDLHGVGEDLQDHLQARLVYRCTRPITLNDDIASVVRKFGIGLRYALYRKGPLTVSAGYAGAFFRTDARLATPDVQAHFINFSTTKMGDKLHAFSGFTASICQLRPESRGFVRIKSADPAARPAIQLNYLAAENDRRTMVAGLKLLRQIMQAPAMRPYVESEYEPGPAYASDADLLRHIRERASTIYHPAGTCRMGEDAAAVVDTRLNVRGVGRLRVIDGSVMPSVVSGNTNAAIIMLAEKGADMILADARRQPALARAASF
jgi:choline dehydrogenase